MRQALAMLLQAGPDARVFVPPDGAVPLAPGCTVGLLPGSFNPMHEGHRRLAAIAEDTLGLPVYYEMSVTNVDKSPLDAGEIMARLEQFDRPVLLTHARLYKQKARLFPGAVFVVGYDTAVRLFQPRYYDDSAAKMHAALDEIMGFGCRFLVAGRVDDTGTFRTLHDIYRGVLPRHRPMLAALHESAFRMDISSTEIRSDGAA